MAADQTPVKPYLVSQVPATLEGPVYRRALSDLAAASCRLVLDVGAGTGENARLVHSRGLWCAAVEYDPDYVTRIGGPAVRGTTDALPFRSGAVGAVIMMHVLEHLPRYREALREVRRILAPGGTLLLEVPNRWTLQELLNHVNTAYFLPPPQRHLGHCNFFDHASLRRLLTDEGFTITGTKLWGGPARATTTTLVDVGLRLLLKGPLRAGRSATQTNEIIARIHERLKPLYLRLSALDERVAGRTPALVTAVGFVCRRAEAAEGRERTGPASQSG